METIVPEIRIDMPAQENTCRICFNDDINAEQMFYVALCGHWFCVECVKQHIEAKLLEGIVLRCPHYQCESKLTHRSCANLLRPKLRAMWEGRIKEESIPVKDRVYCPNRRCSALMSETELSNSVEEAGGSKRSCLNCGKLFCINCKVAWHSNLSCKDYKRLGPNPTKDDMRLKVLANRKRWRQCEKCQHVIELTQGCNHVTCRCGYEFCYTCGAQLIEGRICIHLTLTPSQRAILVFLLLLTTIGILSGVLSFYYI